MLSLKKVLTIVFVLGSLTCFCAAPASGQAAGSPKPNPSAQETQQWRQRGPCSDPWVSKAVTEYKGSVNGAAGYGDCNTRQYNGGSWGNSYDQLYRAVAAALSHPAAPPRDDAILICVSPTVNQIRSADNGANRVSLGVSGGVARFSGNVLAQSYKDTLSAKATTCGARPDVSSLTVDPGHKSDADVQSCLNDKLRQLLGDRAIAGPNSTASVSVTNGSPTFAGTIVSAGGSFGNEMVVLALGSASTKCGGRAPHYNIKFVNPR